MAGGDDRLSELTDDLLRRVLHFAPLKEAASTTALSRRWHTPLYLSSGVVNLETGTGVQKYYHSSRHDDSSRFFSRRDAFDSAAAGALDAADVPVTKLTLRLGSDLHEPVDDYITRLGNGFISHYTNLVGDVLSHRTARRVEELRLDAKVPDHHSYNWVGLYTVTVNSLPLETLRVLEITNCKGILFNGSAVVLPRLFSLRLSHCVQHRSSLQGVIDAAPALTAIHLDSVIINASDPPPRPEEAGTCRLRCPAGSVITLDSCTWEEDKEKQGRDDPSWPCGYRNVSVDVDGVEIDAVRLRRFRYKGPLRSFSFSPRPLELEHVDLHFFGRRNIENNKGRNHDFDTFWRFARKRNFTSTKVMRLRVNHLEDIAVQSEARRVKLLTVFRRLERLEFQGVQCMKDKTAADTTVMNLLRCCPVLRTLQINLTSEHEDASNKEGVRTQFPQKIASMLGPRHLFKCLHSSLRRVGLQFRLEKSDCLGVKLIKFFAENAMVLEEIRIDGGDEKLCEYMNPQTQKWNSRRRKLGATSFALLPLKR